MPPTRRCWSGRSCRISSCGGSSEPLELRGLVRVDIDADQLDGGGPPRSPCTATPPRRSQRLHRRICRRRTGSPAAGRGRIRACARPLCGRRRRWLASRACWRSWTACCRRIGSWPATRPSRCTRPTTCSAMARPRSWLMPIGYGCLGCALPMAIGAKLAAPDRPVLALAGRRRLPVHDPGARDRARSRRRRSSRSSTTTAATARSATRWTMPGSTMSAPTRRPTTWWRSLAGFGVAASRGRSLAELERELTTALASGAPALVEYADELRPIACPCEPPGGMRVIWSLYIWTMRTVVRNW